LNTKGKAMTNNNETRNGAVKSVLMALVLMVAPAMAQKGTVKAETTEPVRRIMVSIPDRKLALIEDDVVVKIYPVAVGAGVSPSPDGSFHIVNRLTNPTYYHTGKVIGPGPQNPLGTRWMGLSQKGYGIHGTNAPRSIGKAASHGCIRMVKADLEDLFNRVKVGDAVEITNQPDDAMVAVFHPSTTQPTSVETVATTTTIAQASGVE
jgi:lipoprotein-anchoring transpeptidase ErfK/SrfK